MKDIKIIIFDIDGTLIAMDQDTISEKNIRSIKATTGKRSQTLFGNRKRTDACPTF